MANDDERRFILDMIDSGKITAEEGLHLLQVLPEDESDGRTTGRSDDDRSGCGFIDCRAFRC